MGINKTAVRFVIHHTLSKSLEVRPRPRSGPPGGPRCAPGAHATPRGSAATRTHLPALPHPTPPHPTPPHPTPPHPTPPHPTPPHPTPARTITRRAPAAAATACTPSARCASASRTCCGRWGGHRWGWATAGPSPGGRRAPLMDSCMLLSWLCFPSPWPLDRFPRCACPAPQAAVVCVEPSWRPNLMAALRYAAASGGCRRALIQRHFGEVGGWGVGAGRGTRSRAHRELAVILLGGRAHWNPPSLMAVSHHTLPSDLQAPAPCTTPCDLCARRTAAHGAGGGGGGAGPGPSSEQQQVRCSRCGAGPLHVASPAHVAASCHALPSLHPPNSPTPSRTSHGRHWAC
jgi:hypothetical protein